MIYFDWIYIFYINYSVKKTNLDKWEKNVILDYKTIMVEQYKKGRNDKYKDRCQRNYN